MGRTEIDVQVLGSRGHCPPTARVRAWVAQALRIGAGESDDLSVCVRVVGDDEMVELNRSYRNAEGTTNVLAFPCGIRDEAGTLVLGDVVISQDQVNREAAAMERTPDDHWAHIVVHGVLHLLGHDHLEPAEAAEMARLEVAALEMLGIGDPYCEAKA